MEEAAAAVDALSVSAAASLLMALVGVAPTPATQAGGSSTAPTTPATVMAMAMNALAGQCP